jgi:hypothetical protein
METIPNVRNPFQVAAIIPLRRKGGNHTLGFGPDCIECSRYNEAVKSEEKAKQRNDNPRLTTEIAGANEIAKRHSANPNKHPRGNPLIDRTVGARHSI